MLHKLLIFISLLILALAGCQAQELADSVALKMSDEAAPVAFNHSTSPRWQEFAIPAATATVGGLFVKTPKLVQARNWVQQQLANPSGRSRTNVDDYLQFLPVAASYGLYFGGMKGEHNLLDRTIIVAMSYAAFAIVNNTLKWAVNEPRPDDPTKFNSFPSNHAGIAFVGAEFLRREYWNQNKWIAMSGYLVGTAVMYLRVYNNCHWINDVITGASLGYLSTTFAYWLYPKIFRHRSPLSSSPSSLSQSPSEGISSSPSSPSSSSSISLYAVPTISPNYFGATALLRF